MVLPLLGGLVGSAIAGTGALGGIAAGLSPLMASAIGSGLGSFVETGDLKEAAMTGALSGLGGAMLGGTAANVAQGATGQGLTEAAKAAGVNASTQAGANLLQNMGQGAAVQGLQKEALNEAVKTGIGGLGGGEIMGNLGSYGKYMLQDPARIAAMTGAAVGPAAMYKPEGGRGYGPPKRGFQPGGARYNAPGGGIGEFDYRYPTNYQDGGIVKMQEGGAVGMPSEKDVITDAVAAIEGRHPAPEIALAKFVQTYGKDALMELVSSVRRGDMQRNRTEDTGMVYGPQTGMDMVPAKNVDNGQDVLLESGEYVLPKATVDAVGEENLDELRAATA